MCQGIAPRVFRQVLSSATSFREYGVQYEKNALFERCFVLFWEEGHVKKVCIGCESLEQPMPKSELVPLARVVCSLESKKLPLNIGGGSPSLLRVMEDSRTDGRRFIVFEQFGPEGFLQCICQAHQDVFGMVEVSTLMEYTYHRMKSALYEEWTENRPIPRKCVRQGFVDFCYLRPLLTDLIELWPTIRPYIRCTGNLEAKRSSDRVSAIFCCGIVFLVSNLSLFVLSVRVIFGS